MTLIIAEVEQEVGRDVVPPGWAASKRDLRWVAMAGVLPALVAAMTLMGCALMCMPMTAICRRSSAVAIPAHHTKYVSIVYVRDAHCSHAACSHAAYCRCDEQ